MPDAASNSAFLVLALLFLLLVTWGPTLIVHRRKRKLGIRVPTLHLLGALLAELGAVIGLAATAHALGLAHQSAYFLVITLVIGAGGGQVYAGMKSGREAKTR